MAEMVLFEKNNLNIGDLEKLNIKGTIYTKKLTFFSDTSLKRQGWCLRGSFGWVVAEDAIEIIVIGHKLDSVWNWDVGESGNEWANLWFLIFVIFYNHCFGSELIFQLLYLFGYTKKS